MNNQEIEDLQNQTVTEYLFGPCSEGVLMDKAATSEYWAKVESFVDENEDKKLKELSFKQRDWLIKIKERLLEI